MSIPSLSSTVTASEKHCHIGIAIGAMGPAALNPPHLALFEHAPPARTGRSGGIVIPH
jgi:hypothetical protein